MSIKKSDIEHNILNKLTIIKLRNDTEFNDTEIDFAIKEIEKYIRGLDETEEEKRT